MAAKPELLEPGDLSCKGWELDSGEKLEDVVSNVTIVASKPVLKVSTPDEEQKKEMLDKIEEEGNTVLESATYNIDLLMCNKSIVTTGSSVRMSVGFPEGYGADTEGVTYKAYHFIKKNGKITDVEEIDCVVTQYGLVIACRSFSPYAVVAVKADQPVKDVKKVAVLNSEGGEVAGDKICSLEKGKSRKVTLKAKDGYCISSINLSGKELAVTDSSSMNVELSYDGLSYDENIMEVIFKAEKKQENQTEQSSSAGNSGSGNSSGTSGRRAGSGIRRDNNAAGISGAGGSVPADTGSAAENADAGGPFGEAERKRHPAGTGGRNRGIQYGCSRGRERQRFCKRDGKRGGIPACEGTAGQGDIRSL